MLDTYRLEVTVSGCLRTSCNVDVVGKSFNFCFVVNKLDGNDDVVSGDDGKDGDSGDDDDLFVSLLAIIVSVVSFFNGEFDVVDVSKSSVSIVLELLCWNLFLFFFCPKDLFIFDN